MFEKLNLVLLMATVVLAFFVGTLWTKVANLEKERPTVAGRTIASQTPPSQPSSPTAGSSVDITDVDLAGEPFIGAKDAPVVLAYWLDFQCPFCKRFDTTTLLELAERYVDKGQLRVVFKDFQFLGPDSQVAGLAAKAVWELYPDKYFAWHKAMFEAQDGENSGFGSKEDIINLTGTIEGVDAEAVSQLLEDKKDEYQKEQDADKAEGSRFGISGTPGFVIGTQRISGAQPTNVFTQIIEAELSK